MVSNENVPLTSFWQVSSALFLTLGWLLPNHNLPWTTFHLDAWVALMIGLVAIAVFFRTSEIETPWFRLTLLATCLVPIPLIQHYTGLVPLIGDAVLSTLYLAGFTLAMMLGSRWDSAEKGQPVDTLFLAIGMAALVSLGLQLYQLFQLEHLELFIMSMPGARFFANFGQPNLLATFMTWGLLALTWGVSRRKIGGKIALTVAIGLLFGIALTNSRTAWVALIILNLACWLKKDLIPFQHFRKTLAVLSLLFVAFIGIAHFTITSDVNTANPNTAHGLSDAALELSRANGEVRHLVWSMFVDAAQQSPWFGYGWNQVAQAQLAVALDHPPIGIGFSHSHNLFLDLVLWVGIPLGLFVSILMLKWLWNQWCNMRSFEDLILLLFVVVVGNHAMLELPLHHAHFLLPTGIVLGVISARNETPLFTTRTPWFFPGLLLASLIFLGLCIRDYYLIETHYRALRLEWTGVAIKEYNTPPETIVLNQWREVIHFARFEPHQGMSPEELDWMRIMTNYSHRPFYALKLAKGLGLNNCEDEAIIQLNRMCRVTSEANCRDAKEIWKKQVLKDPRLAKARWPE